MAKVKNILVTLVCVTSILGCMPPSSTPQLDEHGYTSIHYAAMEKDLDALLYYLAEEAGDPDIPDVAGVTPLQRAARDGSDEVLELLLKYNADPNRLTGTGWSPLQLATRDNHSSTADLLLRYGAQADFQSTDKNSLIQLAMRNNNKEFFKLFLLYGFDINRFHIFQRIDH